MVRLGIDIDGVLSNFDASFFKIARKVFPGRIADDYSPNVWSFEDSGLSKDEISQVWEVLKNTNNFWMWTEPYPDNVQELCGFLNNREKDSTIYYITSRVPTYNGHSVMVQTQKWLESWGLLRKNTSVLPVGQTSHVLTGAPPKNLIVQALDIHEHIDDYLPTVKTLDDRGVLLDRPWNRAERSAKIKVVNSLEEFLQQY